MTHFYAVRHNGKYFKRTGYGGGKQWVVDSLEAATIYPKRSQAVSRVTWWARNAGIIPELIRLSVTVDGVEPMEAHVTKANAKRDAAERRAEIAKKRKAFERAKAEYESVRG